jgi:DNA-binding winged helix-turn-helix (wHTH) protein
MTSGQRAAGSRQYDVPSVLRSRRFERRAGCGAGCSGFAGHDPVAHAAYGYSLGFIASSSWVVRTGPLVVDRRAATATVNGHRVDLTPKEGDLLLYLTARLGQLCGHDDIVRDVWGPEYLLGGRRQRSDRTGTVNLDWRVLAVTMTRLRAKLGEAAGLIVNVSGRGYRLESCPSTEDA